MYTLFVVERTLMWIFIFALPLILSGVGFTMIADDVEEHTGTDLVICGMIAQVIIIMCLYTRVIE